MDEQAVFAIDVLNEEELLKMNPNGTLIPALPGTMALEPSEAGILVVFN
jgi:hypothetical protein